uniref:Uncharacterized protein n=1 Tax=Meloidogyne hapla TaxID=6305 RepID=A0A1I8BVU0_MELHA
MDLFLFDPVGYEKLYNCSSYKVEDVPIEKRQDIVFWVIESSGDIILAVNRCVEIISPIWGERLYNGRRAWLWMLPPMIYGFFRISEFIIYTASFLWVTAHGLPSLIYLFMNKTIRNDFFAIFGYVPSQQLSLGAGHLAGAKTGHFSSTTKIAPKSNIANITLH